MKGLKTILGISLAATGFAGTVAFGTAALTNTSKTKIAEASDPSTTDGTIEIRFTRPSDWGNNTVCIHTWNEGGSGTTWPGNAMTYLWDNEYGQSVWSWSPSAGTPLYGNIIFNNNNNGMQSSTLSSPSTSKFYWYDNGWQNSDVPTMDVYLYDYDNKFGGNVTVHAWRYGTTFANDTWPGNAATQLTSVATNGLIYKFTMNNRYDRVIFSNSGDDQTGDLTSAGNHCYVLANDETVLDGKNTWWDNLNYVFAHNFAQNTMLMRSIPTSDQSSTAECASRYSAAKTAFNTLKASTYGTDALNELNNNFADAMTRLSAWATANGQTFNSSTGSFSSKIVEPLEIKNTTYVSIAIVAIVVVTAGSLGAYFLIKKKKHQ